MVSASSVALCKGARRPAGTMSLVSISAPRRMSIRTAGTCLFRSAQYRGVSPSCEVVVMVVVNNVLCKAAHCGRDHRLCLRYTTLVRALMLALAFSSMRMVAVSPLAAAQCSGVYLSMSVTFAKAELCSNSRTQSSCPAMLATKSGERYSCNVCHVVAVRWEWGYSEPERTFQERDARREAKRDRHRGS